MRAPNDIEQHPQELAQNITYNIQPGATFIQNQNITNYYAGGKSEEPQKEDPSPHPLLPFVAVMQKKAVIDWLHANIDTHSDKRDKLAFLKAAMECSPRAVQDSVTVEIFNAEFGTDISEATFLDCIRSYHKFSYGPELQKYKIEISAIAKSEIANC